MPSTSIKLEQIRWNIFIPRVTFIANVHAIVYAPWKPLTQI